MPSMIAQTTRQLHWR